MKNRFQYFFMLTFSTLLIAAGTYFFKFTNNFTFGGITGLAVLVAKTGAVSERYQEIRSISWLHFASNIDEPH